MTCGPLRRVYIGSNKYSSTRRTPKPILALVTSISKRVLVATSTRFPRVILASIEYTLYSFYTLPQTDDQKEHVNQEIEQYLCMFISHRQGDWAEWLPLAELAYNSQVHSSTCQSPFEIDNGTHPQMGIELCCQARVEAANELADSMGRLLEETRASLKQAASDMIRFYDTDHREAEESKVGDKVWLDG
jgi:hypothetical protein